MNLNAVNLEDMSRYADTAAASFIKKEDAGEEKKASEQSLPAKEGELQLGKVNIGVSKLES